MCCSNTRSLHVLLRHLLASCCLLPLLLPVGLLRPLGRPPCGNMPFWLLPTSGCSHNFKFAVPESFRVGTLDSLLGLSDDLAKARRGSTGEGEPGLGSG